MVQKYQPLPRGGHQSCRSVPPNASVGFPAESGSERRTILTPAVAWALTGAGFSVIAERGIGSGVFIGDDVYDAAGSRLRKPTRCGRRRLSCATNSRSAADLGRLDRYQRVAALFHAEGDPDLLAGLKASRSTAWSYEFVTHDGHFPLGRPGDGFSGAQAVLAGARALQAPPGRGVLLVDVEEQRPRMC